MKVAALTRERKILIIIGGLLLLLGAVYRFYPVISGQLNNGGDLSVKLKRLAKYQQRVATREQTHQRLVEATRRLERAQQLLLDSATPALAAVEIQNSINEIVNANNLEVASLQVLKAAESETGGHVVVPVRITLKLTIRQLLDLLYKVESAAHLLTVTDLSVRGANTSAPGELNASITVAGYMKKK